MLEGGGLGSLHHHVLGECCYVWNMPGLVYFHLI